MDRVFLAQLMSSRSELLEQQRIAVEILLGLPDGHPVVDRLGCRSLLSLASNTMWRRSMINLADEPELLFLC